MAGVGAALVASGCDAQLPFTGPRICDPPPPPPTGIDYSIRPSLGDRISRGSVRLRSDGAELAGLHRGQVLIWGATDGRIARRIGKPWQLQGSGEVGGNDAFDALGDFARFAVMRDGKPGLLDTSDTFTALTTEVDPAKHPIADLQFSPDGDRLAMLSRSGNVELLKVADGTSLGVLAACTESAQMVRFSPDGRLVAVGSFDRPAQVWDTEGGTMVATLGDKDHGSGSVAWNRDGSRLGLSATAWNSDASWHTALYDTSTWKAVEYHDVSATTLGFLPDDSLVVMGDGSNRLKTWDMVEGSDFKKYPIGLTVAAVLVGADGRTYVNNSNNLIEVDPRTGKVLVEFEAPEFDCSGISTPSFYPECS